MPATSTTRIDAVLDGQRHLVTPAQATAAGAHRSTLARLVKSGDLELVEARVYGRVGVELTWDRRLLAVLLSAGPPARASHRAVARLLGIETWEGAPLEISVPSKCRRRWEGVIVHESRDLTYVPPIWLDGIPCTPPRRLAVDLGAVVGTTAYTTVIRHLRRDHQVTWKQLAAILQLHSKRGRIGCGQLRRQLERYYGIDGIPDSTLEQGLLDAIIDADLPVPVCQHEVPRAGGHPYRIDLAYPELRLAIEVDGPHHELPHVAARDRARDAYLRSRGWTVLRFREELVAYAPAMVIATILRTLHQLAGQHA